MKTKIFTLFILIALALLAQPSFAAEEHEHDHLGENSHDKTPKETGHEHANHQEDEKHDKLSHKEDKAGHEGHHHQRKEEEVFLELSSEKAMAAGITISKARQGTLSGSVTLPGEIAVNGDSLVHIAARFAGTLKSVSKHVGQKVKAGEVLATVQSNESLSLYKIKADTSGVVIDKDASIGEFVTNDKVIFTIANFDQVWVNAAVHVRDLKHLRTGLPATIDAKSINLSQVSEIAYLRPTLSEITRTALARLILDNSEGKWLPGMFVQVTVETSSNEPQLLIPVESAVFVGNEYVAFVKGKSSDGHTGFERRDIEIGKEDGVNIEVLNGISEGDEVAAGETFILKAELGKGSAGHQH